jgi:outer membrane lipoprotein-sorting protein
MKRIIFTLICALSLANVSAQTAKEILDKAASVVNAKKGATADFVMSGKYGNAAGTISIKGNKFVANTPQAKMWYDGKTQWTYMTSTEEVNVSTPTEAQQQTMNPYRFINLYNMGYAMTKKEVKNGYEVYLKATNPKRTITEMYITVNNQFVPTNVKMKTAKGWTNINISNFRKASLPDKAFRFNAKDYPKAEVIDLR